MQTGGTLIVDEFDASIHPMALMSIINIFHNDDINIHNAQLIFNTHNPIFLNSNLLEEMKLSLWSVMITANTAHFMLYLISERPVKGRS